MRVQIHSFASSSRRMYNKHWSVCVVCAIHVTQMGGELSEWDKPEGTTQRMRLFGIFVCDFGVHYYYQSSPNCMRTNPMAFRHQAMVDTYIEICFVHWIHVTLAMFNDEEKKICLQFSWVHFHWQGIFWSFGYFTATQLHMELSWVCALHRMRCIRLNAAHTC